jgi:hypothetical protein
MPINGEKNEQFGVYKSVCCGLEIVIAAGVHFPDCPKHPKLPTKWKSVTDEPIRHASELGNRKKSRDDSAA